MSIRTRFAPSPTGLLHIGSVRTALYSWALAKQSGGSFILRIEDTDQERKVEGSINFIVKELLWLGLEFDEGPSLSELESIGESTDGLIETWDSKSGPYVQSLRKDLYKKYAEELVDAGHAYRCDCTPEMLERERREQTLRRERPGYSGRCRHRNVSPDTKHAIRLMLPEEFTINVEDGLRGKLKFENPPLRDPVLLKSDGFPTYHLALVLDDHFMKISHVLRGEEWLATFPVHWYLYELFGWEKPVFVHLPVILGEDGKKLSKRHGATTTADLRKQGYIPEAILNSLALVGWTHPSGKELFTVDDFVRNFSLDKIHASSGIFSFSKLKKFNHEHLKQLNPADFLKLAREQIDIPEFSHVYLQLLQERVHTLVDLNDLLVFIHDSAQYEFDKLREFSESVVASVVTNFVQKCQQTFSREGLNNLINQLAEKFNLKKSEAFKILRIAFLKRLETPPLVDTLLEMGLDWVVTQGKVFLTEFEKNS
ncbi:MAG: glutamate--tRNA ligase [Deltaproteobacteria bacterium]|nr:glutamate--tRNA ligase [Deltaproteobacteria bacterium]